MAKEELDRVSISANETAVNVKQQDVALLLKKKNAVDQQAETTEAEAHVDQAAVETQEEALMVASADSVFASDGAYMVAQAGGTTAASGGGISTGTLLAIGGVALVGGGIAIAASDDDNNNEPAPVPTSVNAPASVNEGETVTFAVTGNPGAVFNYVLSGVQAEDIAGGAQALSGTVTLDDNGNGTVNVTLLEDELTEGSETLTLTVDGASRAVVVNDTSLSQPQDLTSEVETVNGTEGDDIFNGTVVAGAFGPITGETANAGDVVNGLGGNDTFNIDFQGGPFGGAVLADVTTNSVENIVASFNSVSGNQANTIDAVTFNDVENFTVVLRAPNSSGSLNVLSLSGALDTFSLNGGDRIAGANFNSGPHQSFYTVNVQAGSEALTIEDLSVSDIFGSATVTLTAISNIPTITLTNVGIDASADIRLDLLDTVTDDALTVTINNVGDAFNGSSTEIDVDNLSGMDVLDSIALTVAGGVNNYIDFNDTSLLSSVVVDGAGDALVTFSGHAVLGEFDASLATGDIATTLTTTVDVTATFGSGNDSLELNGSGDATVNMGGGNDVLDLGGSGDTTALLGDGNDLVRMFSNNTDTLDLGAGDDVLIASSGTLGLEDVANGGAGFDTLGIDVADFNALTDDVIPGFENLLAQGASGSYDLTAAGDFTQATVGGFDAFGIGPAFFAPDFDDPQTTTNFQLVSTQANAYTFNGASSAFSTLVVNFNAAAVTLTRDVDAVDDELTLLIGNDSDDANNTYDVLTLGSLTVDNENALNITSFGFDDGGGDANVISVLIATQAATITIDGDKDLVLSDITGVDNLQIIDASAFTANLSVLTAAGNVIAVGGVQFIGGTGNDTYTGTDHGDSVNGGAGNDVILLGAAGAEDTLIYEAGDSLAGSEDSITGFVVLEDVIDVGFFGFTGQQASAVASGAAQDALYADLVAADADTVLADFFADAGADRGVAISSNGADSFVAIDVDGDGNFNGDVDLLIFFVGTVGISHDDFGF